MKTIVCIASGPSLTPEDVAYCRGKAEVIVVNDNYRLAPWADVLYATDFGWWKVYIDDVRATFAGQLLTVDECAAKRFCVPWVRGIDTNRLSRRLDQVSTGDNSGFAAMNVAVHRGATRIVLLGYDMQGEHWFGRHPETLSAVNDFPKYMSNFAQLAIDLDAAGVEVVNCSRETALTCFPRARLKEVL